MKKTLNNDYLRLRAWRNGLKISQEKAAEIMQTPVTTYRNWEQSVCRIPGLVWAYIEIQENNA